MAARAKGNPTANPWDNDGRTHHVDVARVACEEHELAQRRVLLCRSLAGHCFSDFEIGARALS